MNLAPSDRADMTLPRAERLMLIALASSCPSLVVPVLEDFSEPAKSTKDSLPIVLTEVFMFVESTMMEKIKCDREDSSFMSVFLVFLCESPSSKIASA